MEGLRDNTLTYKVVRNGGGGGEKLAVNLPGAQGDDQLRHQRHNHHHHHQDELQGDAGGGEACNNRHHLERGGNLGVRTNEIVKGIPGTERREEGRSADHLHGQAIHQPGLGGADAVVRGAIQTWNKKIKISSKTNNKNTTQERGHPFTTDIDRSSSTRILSQIDLKEGRKEDEEARNAEGRKQEEVGRQEPGRYHGLVFESSTSNICITRTSKVVTYRGAGKEGAARGSRKTSCSSSSPGPTAPQSSSSSVERYQISPSVYRRSPSPVNIVTGREISASKCRGTIQLSGGRKTTEAAADYWDNEMGGNGQQ